MISFHLRGANELERQLAKLPDDIAAAELEGVRRATIMARNALFEAMSGVATPVPFWGVRSPAGPVLAARTGHTRAAITPGRVWQVAGSTFGSVGHDEPHVAALEDGATIRPTAGQYLRIPTENALTPSGADRYAGQSIRTIPGARLVRSKAGLLWAVRDVGRGSTAAVQYLYLLVREIKLPAKHIFATVRQFVDSRLDDTVDVEIVRALRKAA